ncbi:MAG: hypothetical protein ACOYN4_00765 [Bacteroidales bacterium]
MGEFETWVYRGLIAIGVIIIWWAAKRFISKVLDKLDQLIEKIDKLAEANSAHEEKFTWINKTVELLTNQVKGLEARLRRVENQYNKCKNCNPE